MAAEWPGLEGMDLAKDVSRLQVERWSGGKWAWDRAMTARAMSGRRMTPIPTKQESPPRRRGRLWQQAQHLPPAGRGRRAGDGGAGDATFDEIMAHEPDGFFLSNGPGDPAATGEYAVPVIQADAGDEEAAVRHLPRPPDAGARGRREDVKDVPGPPRRQPPGQAAGRRPVEITSMNHGFAVERKGLPEMSAKRMCRCSTAAIAGSS